LKSEVIDGVTIVEVDDEIIYDGTQIDSKWALRKFGILGNSVVYWRGPMNVKKVIDIEDKLLKRDIRGKDVLHFKIELFDAPDIRMAYMRQRILVVVAKEFLEDITGKKIKRVGDDLYYNDGKLSVSIATVSLSSELIHFGINITSSGVPKGLKVSSLDDLGLSDWRFIGYRISKRFIEELKKIEWDIAKSEVIGD